MDWKNFLKENNFRVIGKYLVGNFPSQRSSVPLLVIDTEKNTYTDLREGRGGTIDDLIHQLKLEERPRLSLAETEKPVETDEDKRYKAILADAEVYYKNNLSKGAAKYLDDRGFSLDDYSFGYAGSYGDKLYKYLIKHGHNREDILETKLCRLKDDRPVDVFWKRLMIPIKDAYGDTVAFGGRILEKSDDVPKYINSPESVIFKKRELLFGYDRAKSTECTSYILCEGYMDVLKMHQAGFTNTVAALGTALTQEQCQLLKNKTRVYIMQDNDVAGICASIKAIPLLQKMGFDVRRVILPSPYKDPDEFLREKGRDELADIIRKESLSGEKFMIDNLGDVKKAVNYIAHISDR
jgi:DNA primase (bacterial type)